MSTQTVTTVGGWVTIAVVVGGIYYISNKNNKTRRPTISKQVAKPSESKKDVKSKKAKKSVVQSDGDSEVKSASEGKQKKKKTADASAKDEEPTYVNVSPGDYKDDEADNREFARQMAKAKTGAIVAPKSKAEARQKSVKQSKAQEKQAAEMSSDNFTAPSSANGADADDDQSPVVSPDLSATPMEAPVTNGISDMLEKPAPGPSVLNIKAPTNPPPAKKPKQQAAPEPTETKKQRQNRQKAEARKVAREEDEAVRQKLMEQQRRTARLAEGRAAKDGSAFMASMAPATSSWAAPPTIANGGSVQKPSPVELLDTIETHSKKPEASAPVQTGSQTQEAASSWQASLPSEEEQIRMIQENDNWETVKTKERKNKGSRPSKENGNPKDESSADETKDSGIPPQTTPPAPGKKWEATLVHVDEDKNVIERQVDLEDSEWEVS